MNLLVGYISETMKLGALGLPLYRTFVLEELKEATDNFNASFLIGEGSYGQVHMLYVISFLFDLIFFFKLEKKNKTISRILIVLSWDVITK